MEEVRPRWSFASASVTGTSHVATNTPCQDACRCTVVRAPDDSEILVAVVADGAGSASRSRDGSRIACDATLEIVQRSIAGQRGFPRRGTQLARGVIRGIQRRLDAATATNHCRRVDFACTLLAAIAGPDSSLFFQIGDGAIVYNAQRDAGAFRCAFWPERGEYANETTFVTSRTAALAVRCLPIPMALSEVALFTDGLQNLVLDYKENSPHSPFFDHMLTPLRSTGAGEQQGLSSALEDFLKSPRVNERTDDDKTLLLASRESSVLP